MRGGPGAGGCRAKRPRPASVVRPGPRASVLLPGDRIVRAAHLRLAVLGMVASILLAGALSVWAIRVLATAPRQPQKIAFEF